MEAYCVKCKTKKEIQNPTVTLTKNRLPQTKGTCPTCGTKIFCFGMPKVDAAPAAKPVC